MRNDLSGESRTPRRRINSVAPCSVKPHRSVLPGCRWRSPTFPFKGRLTWVAWEFVAASSIGSPTEDATDADFATIVFGDSHFLVETLGIPDFRIQLSRETVALIASRNGYLIRRARQPLSIPIQPLRLAGTTTIAAVPWVSGGNSAERGGRSGNARRSRCAGFRSRRSLRRHRNGSTADARRAAGCGGRRRRRASAPCVFCD